MKAARFWTIYVLAATFGLGVFYAFAGSMEDVPLRLSDSTMEHIRGSESNATCYFEEGCPWSGCENNLNYEYFNTYETWWRCQEQNVSTICSTSGTVTICNVKVWYLPGCQGDYTYGSVDEPASCTEE